MNRLAEAIEQLRSKGLDPHLGEDHDYKECKKNYDLFRSCESKQGFDSEQEAMRHIHKLKRETGSQWFREIYPCPHCRKFHIKRRK